MSKAIFIYTSGAGSSRCDLLDYVGLLAPDQDPMTLIVPYLKANHTYLDEALEADQYEGISYALFDLDKPGPFLHWFEHEESKNLLKDTVHITKALFDATP